MNRPSLRTRRSHASGFTLIELLVVIGIIAILAAVLMTVGNNVIKKAKQAKAANTATQIQTACLAYYTEYSVYPIPASATASADYIITDSTAASDTAWGNLICSLCGMINPSTAAAVTASTSIPTNTRSIAFLSMKSSDVDTLGAPLNPLPSTNGTSNLYFNIAMDGDYDGLLGTAGASLHLLPNFSVAQTGSGASATPTMTGSSTAGIAVWANCNNSTTISALSNWVHTF